MSNRSAFRIISLAFILALFSLLAIHDTDAQDQPRSPQPKQVQRQNDPKERSGAQRQSAQVEAQAPSGENRIRIDTDLVNVDVIVVDQNNNPIFDLNKEDFSVYEDGVKQTVESVSREEVPVSFGLVIDASGSMRTKLRSVTDAALSLIKQMRRDEEAFVATFKTEPELIRDFTSDKSELESALHGLYASGGTALLDAIISAADYAHEKGKRRRKALVVFSDGLDKNSLVKEKRVIEAIKKDEIQIHLVGFIDEDMDLFRFRKLFAKRARELLSRITDDSGGRAYFPKDVSEIPAVAAQIVKELRTQYIVSYYPTNNKRDGAFHTIQVNVNNAGGRNLTVRARRGYYAIKEKEQAPAASQKKD
jgi:Ca-activated chloride channel homolog